jgi:hypothetical protein
MTRALQYIAWAVGLWLNVLVISALLRGSYRQYRFISAYAVALLLSTIVEIAARTAPLPVPWNVYYWVNEGILDILVFCVVISLIDDASKNIKRLPIHRRWLIAGATFFFVASLMVHRGPRLNYRMTLVSRDLDLCAVVLDLILWILLAASRRPNHRLLLLSGGLGIQLTGAILGQSVRQLSRSTVLPGALLEVVTGLVGLYIWWRALRTPQNVKSAPA